MLLSAAATGWYAGSADLAMTALEAVLPELHCYAAAEYIARRHYARGLHGPGALELVLSAIRERAGNVTAAEEYLTQAIALRPDVSDFYLHLGHFFDRQGRKADALTTFEKALTLPQRSRAEFESVKERVAELRGQVGN